MQSNWSILFLFNSFFHLISYMFVYRVEIWNGQNKEMETKCTVHYYILHYQRKLYIINNGKFFLKKYNQK